jgi:hypothetical protein
LTSLLDVKHADLSDSPLLGVFGSRPAVPAWYRDVMMLNDAACLHVLISSCILQDLTVTDLLWVSMVSHVIITIILWPLINLVHILIFVTTVVSPPEGFDVITKT